MSDYTYGNRVWVEDYLKSNLGHPVLDLIAGEETPSIEQAIKNALVVYWNALPFVHPLQYETAIEEGPKVVTEESVLAGALAGLQGAAATEVKAVVIGPVRIDELNFPSLNRRLAGYYGNDVYGGATTFGRAGYGDHYHGRPLNIEQELLYSTEQDLVTGEISYEYNNLLRCYVFETPNTVTRFIVWWGIGFYSDLNLERLKESHIVMFSKMVLYEFLNIIVKARSSVEISNDVQINYSVLESQMGDLKTELQEELQKYTMIPAIFS